MKRILAIVVCLILLVSSTAIADNNDCNCNCPYCCGQLITKVKSTFTGSVWFPIRSGLIVGVKDPHEERQDDFGGFIGLQKDWSRDLAYPEMLGNGKCRRARAWAEINMIDFLAQEAWKSEALNGKIEGMTKFRNVTISVKSEYASRVEHAVRSFYAINFGIPYNEVIMSTESISLALMHFYSVSDSICTGSVTFFTSESRSEVCGTMRFETGSLDIKIGYFDDDDIEDIGLVPGVKPQTKPTTEPEPQPTPKPQKQTNSSGGKTSSTKTLVTVNVSVNNVVNKVVGLFNKVTTIIQNQVGTGCNNQQKVIVPGCK